MSSMPSSSAAQPDKSGPVARRLLRDYVGSSWGLLLLAVFCMLLTSAVSGLVPMLVNLEVKLIFLRHQAEMLLPMSLAVVGVVGFRAVTLFFGRMTLDSLGEKTVASAQRDMFSRLIHRDLADLNAVHSGQFVSNFLYDATLMRDEIGRASCRERV